MPRIRARRWRSPALAAAAWLLLWPTGLRAQAADLPASEPESPAPAPAAETAPCADGRISSVWVDNHSVFDLTDPERTRRLDWAFRLANRLHVRTRESVIRRELVFAEGDCYDPARLRESERVLRRTGFIAEVDIFGVQQPDGTYHVIVDTRDEWTTRVEPQSGQGTGLRVTGLALSEDNLLGTGRKASLFYLQDRETRIYGLSYMNPQLFATRWQAGFAVGRTPTGGFFRETLEYPFVGESGRRAFRHHFEHHDRFFGYLAPYDDGLLEVLMPEQRRSFDVGGAVRLGRRGRLTLLGAMLTGNWVSYPEPPRLADPSQPVPDSLLSSLLARHDSIADVRAVLLVGQRSVRFVRERALDTVNGTEDVRLGVEVELGLGRSIGALSSGDDLSLDLGVFAAGQPARNLITGTRLVLEGRRNYEAPAATSEWDDVFAQFDAWAYWRPTSDARHTLVGMLATSGGWHPRVPFQLTLGGATGLRGQPFHVAAGARRAVFSLESRNFLGWPYPELFDLGSTVFVDLGRVWAGSAPFGVTSETYGNLGVGLRTAFPPGSHNTVRFDVAAPVRRGAGFSDLVISVGVRQGIGRTTRNDPEMYRSSRRGAATSLFGVRTDPEQ